MKMPKLTNKLKLKNWKLNKMLDEAAGEYKSDGYLTATELHYHARFGIINPYVKWVPKKWKMQGVSK
jgi:hypothetical protein